MEISTLETHRHNGIDSQPISFDDLLNKPEGDIVRRYTASGSIIAGDAVVQGSNASEASAQTPTRLGQVYEDTTWTTPFASIYQIIKLDTDFYAALGEDSGGNPTVAVARYMAGRLVWSASTDLSSTGSDSPISICKLSTSKFLVAYSMGTNDVTFKAVSVANWTLTVGTGVALGNNSINGTSGCLNYIADDKAHFVRIPANGSGVLGQVLTTSGTTITDNGSSTLDSTTSLTNCVSTVIDTNKVMVFFGKTASAYALTLTISGTSQSAGSAQTLSSIIFNTQLGGWIIKLDTDKALITGVTSGNVGKALIATASGTTTTLGSEVQIETANAENLQFGAVKVSSGRVLLTYGKSTNLRYGHYITYSGTTITAGTAFLIYSSSNNGFIWEGYTNNPFEFFFYDGVKLILAYARSTSKAIGVAKDTIANSNIGEIMILGRITGLSGYAVGDEIRDRYNYNIIAIADTTTSLLVTK